MPHATPFSGWTYLLLVHWACRISRNAFAFGNILGDDRTGAGQRPVADGDGSDQRLIRADCNVASDDRWMLPLAVEVAGNRSGAHVRLFADRCIPQVRKMADLDAAGQIRFLDLDEVTDVSLLAEPSLTTEMGERPDPDVVAGRRVADDALAHRDAIA